MQIRKRQEYWKPHFWMAWDNISQKNIKIFLVLKVREGNEFYKTWNTSFWYDWEKDFLKFLIWIYLMMILSKNVKILYRVTLLFHYNEADFLIK